MQNKNFLSGLTDKLQGFQVELTRTKLYLFALTLIAFGLALGGLWIKRRIDTIHNPIRFLIVVQIVMGGLALSTLFLYGSSFKLMQYMLGVLTKTDGGYILFNVASHGIALFIMLPATFCAGMTLPLITHILLKEKHGEKSIGAVYAANTIGAILGVVRLNGRYVF